MNLAFTTTGEGPPLVLLHGLFGSGDNLKRVASWFKTTHSVVLPDLPNHGSSPHLESADYDVMVAGVADFLTENDLAPCLLGGHSMGGKVAMGVALARPELVSGLLILDMGPGEYPPSHADILKGLVALPIESINSRAEADDFLAADVPEPAVRAFLLKNLDRSESGYRWRFNLGVINRDYSRILRWTGTGSFSGPALFVGGTESHYLDPKRDNRNIQHHFPQAEISMIDGAHHWLHTERPEELRAIMSGFLESLNQR